MSRHKNLECKSRELVLFQCDYDKLQWMFGNRFWICTGFAKILRNFNYVSSIDPLCLFIVYDVSRSAIQKELQLQPTKSRIFIRFLQTFYYLHIVDQLFAKRGKIIEIPQYEARQFGKSTFKFITYAFHRNRQLNGQV